MSSTSSSPCGHPRKPASSVPLDFASFAPETFVLLGVPELKDCTKQGEELRDHLSRADEADARVDCDELSRGIRRSLRVEFARAADLRPAGVPLKKWVAETFGDYGTVQRYSRIARLQVQLANRELPLIKTVNQGRALLPYADHPDLFTTLRAMAATDRLPETKLLKAALVDRLGVGRRADPKDTLARALRVAIKLVDLLPRKSGEPLLAEVREAAESIVAKLSTATASQGTGRAERKRQRKLIPGAEQAELFVFRA